MNMSTRKAISLGKAIIKAVTDNDPIGTVRKAGGISYKKTPDGWMKVGGGEKPPKIEAMFGLTSDEVRKALDAVKVVMKARYEEGHVSHRKGGDFIKQGGSWIPYKQGGGAAEKQAPAPSNQNPNAPAPEGGMSIAPPPSPAEDAMNNRSLASMSEYNNASLIQDAKEGIAASVKSNGIDATVKQLKQGFEDAGVGDLFDMHMPLEQMAQLMAQNGIQPPKAGEGVYGFGGRGTVGGQKATVEDIEEDEPNYESASDVELDDYENELESAMDDEGDDYSDVPWASAINLTAEDAGYDEGSTDFEAETKALKKAAEAYRNGERSRGKLESIMENVYYNEGGSDHQGWDTFMDSVWESASDLGGNEDDDDYDDYDDDDDNFERSAEDTQVTIQKDGLGSDCGGGSTPNSPLIGPGDRAENRIGKSARFNPLTGRYR
jgi:hypothetical protein